MSIEPNSLHQDHPWAESEDRPRYVVSKRVYTEVDAAAFKRGMRRLSAAVTVVTTGSSAADRAGLTATAVCSVCAEPPQLLVCVNKSSEAGGIVRRLGNFCVNVLSHDQINIAKRFSGMDGSPRSERFALGEWGVLQSGAPALEGCLANFDCMIEQQIEAGTHVILIGRIVSIAVNTGLEPLAFVNGQFLALAGAGPGMPDAALWDWS